MTHDNDYRAANRAHGALKAKLTRAVKSGDPVKILATCREAVKVWESSPNYGGAWPDDWADWQRALDDAQFNHYPFRPNTRLDDL